MNKKIFCWLLTVFMLLQFGLTAIAADHFDNVETTAKIQVVKAGETITAATPNTVSVTKKGSEPFPAFDYLCTMNMQNVRDKFTAYYTNWASILGYINLPADKMAELNRKLEAMQVTGEFTIEITYPNSLQIPAAFLESGQMYGFDDNARLIFGNDVRTLTQGTSENTLKIVVAVVGKDNAGTRPGYVLAKDLKDNLSTFLSDFTLKCEGVGTTEYGTFAVKGKVTGFTLAASDSTDFRVDYKTAEDAIARCNVKKPTGGGEGNTLKPTVLLIHFDVEGDRNVVDSVKKEEGATVKVSELKVPHKDGYAFDGWYLDNAYTQKLTGDFEITESITLYGKWNKSQGVEILDSDDHFAYVIGYPEGDVRPENSITREEITTIFFRLLTNEKRDALLSKSSSFSDVAVSHWSNTAISTMEKGGFITGYEDGSFAPAKYITRAEFATIASRLDTMSDNVSHGFTDISGHWAEKYIADAVVKGWIAGYEDGTFRPDQEITRAEAMTIINRMLNRFVNEAGLHKDATLWPDNSKDAWYYYAVLEATNSHECTRQADGVHETWTAMTENRDWLEYEK